MSANSLYSPEATPNCALAMVNVPFKGDASESYKIDGAKSKSGVFCVACKAGYVPKYSSVSGLTMKVVECQA